MTNLRQFFEDIDHQLSIARLLMFMSWFPATYVLIRNPTDTMLGWYLSAFVLGYVGSKINDSCTTIFKKPTIEGDNHDRGYN